jgi:hypothetical protein
MKRQQNSIRISVWAFFALTISMLVLPTSRTVAQESGWTRPVELSGVTQSSWFPDLAVGPDGGIHAIWASGIQGGEETVGGIDLLMYSRLKDGQWTQPTDIVNPGEGGFATRSSIALGRDGKFHLLVRNQLRIDYLQAPWDKAGTFHGWSEPRKLNNDNDPYYNVLTIDSKNSLHAFWNEKAPEDDKSQDQDCPDCSDLFYRRSPDAGVTWSTPINLSESLYGSVKPQVKIDKDDHLHLVWDEGYDNINGKGKSFAARYRRSTDGGLSWSQPITFTLPTLIVQPDPNSVPEGAPLPKPQEIFDAPMQITLGLYQNSQPVVVYRSNVTQQMYYHFSQDGGTTWSQALPLPGVRARDPNDGRPFDSYWMTTDSAGNVHLFFSGFLVDDKEARSRPRIIHLTWNGQSWSAPEVVASDSGHPDWNEIGNRDCDELFPFVETQDQRNIIDQCQLIQRYPEWPRAVVANGNQLHLVWFTRSEKDRNDSDHPFYKVWYSTKQLNTPAVETLPLFTPVPTAATIAPTATPAPTPTPAPPAEFADTPIIDGPVAWEGPGMITVGIATLSVLGFLGIVLFGRLLMSRVLTSRANRAYRSGYTPRSGGAPRRK